MTTAYYSHKVCIDHQPGPRHPESPERLKAIYQTLEGNDFDSLKRLDAPKAKPQVVELMHDSSYVNYVLDSIPSEGYKALDQLDSDSDRTITENSEMSSNEEINTYKRTLPNQSPLFHDHRFKN